jgi:protein SCO1/2
MATAPDSTAEGVHVRRRVMAAVLVMLLTSTLSVAWVVYLFVDADNKSSVPLPLLSTLRPEPKPLSEFLLTDQFGKEFTLGQLKGKWSFVFFGYTACPDICPTTLSEMIKVSNVLAGKGVHKDDVNFIFVSVDPGRDSVVGMKEYMDYVGHDFIGLVGGQSQLDVLMQQLNILAVRKESTAPENYTISHSSSIKLIDPQARWLASFSPPHSGDGMAKKFILIQDHYKQAN